MSELPTSFWSGWIIGLTLTSLIGLAVLLFSIYFGAESKKQDKDENTVWDQTLREGSNAPPLWWFWFFLATLIYTAGYLILFPGLGRYAGLLEWTQQSQLMMSEKQYQDQYGELRSRWLSTELSELSLDKKAMRTASHIFLQNCASCHGQDAKGGANYFPDLTDFEWQWGGNEKAILTSLREGRRATMPAWKKLLNEQEINAVAAYILALGSDSSENTRYQEGQKIYQTFCIACHGVDGGGNAALGAPNLSNDIWLYGKDAKNMRTSIKHGRNGVMPAWKDRLDETQIHLLAAWLISGAEIR